MNTSNGIVDIHGLAKFLNCSKVTIQRTWRTYPHFFIGLGKTGKSARFDISDVIWFLKNRDYPNGISRSKNKKMGWGFKNNGIPQKKEKRIQDKESSKKMGERKTGTDSEPRTGTDPIEDFRSMFALS